MIPKRIFYVWGSNEPKKRDVLACMQSWRQLCPEYKIIEINEDSVEYFDFQKELQSNEWFNAVYHKRMWAFVADYIRIKVLHDHGGIYLDTDVTVLKNFDDFLHETAFVGMQDNAIDGKYDHVEPAILGAQKHNKVLKCILDIYTNDIWNIPIYTMPDLFSFALEKLYSSEVKQFSPRSNQIPIDYPDIKIYPEKVFIPLRYREEFTPECITSETHTIHWWGASWIKPDILNFLQHKSKDIKPLNGYYCKMYLFGFIPFIKAFISKNQIRIARWLTFYVVRDNESSKSNYSVVFELKLLKKIPILRIESKEHGKKKKYYLFGIYLIKTTQNL